MVNVVNNLESTPNITVPKTIKHTIKYVGLINYEQNK